MILPENGPAPEQNIFKRRKKNTMIHLEKKMYLSLIIKKI